MQDARLSTALPGHPKTKKLIRRLGPAAGWSLVCLILWTRANRPDGDLSGMSVEDIELAAEWTGENDAFVRELVDIRFLDEAGGRYQLHDWAEHQPWAAGSDMRSLKARWSAVKRHHGVREADRQVPEYARIRAEGIENDASGMKNVAGSNAVALPPVNNGNAKGAESPAPSPSPSPSPSPIPSPSPRAEQKAPAEPADFRKEIFDRWKALPAGGGAAFLVKLLKDHKPEQRVLEAVERTLEETRADPKAFVLGILRKEAKAEDDYDLLMARVR